MDLSEGRYLLDSGLPLSRRSRLRQGRRLRPTDWAIPVRSADAPEALLDGESSAPGPELRPATADSAGTAAGDDGLLAEAANFVASFHAENPAAGSAAERMRQIRREISATGTYRHTDAELTFAAQVAWRNSCALHRPTVLAEPAGARPAAHHLGGRHRRRVRRPPAGRDQRRPDQAADHRVRPRCPRPARPADPQLPARALRRARGRQRRRHR